METKHKFSRKRQAILELLQHTTEHPSAEMIYTRLKPEIPDLSLATVYRNLAAFHQEGIVSVVSNVQDNDRYDACTDPHPHFICKACGKVIDLPCDRNLPELAESLVQGTGCSAEMIQISIYGLCEVCRDDA